MSISTSTWLAVGQALLRRLTPGESRADLAAQLAAVTAERNAFAREAAYWKAKTELLLDNALLRRGESPRPVFSDTESSIDKASRALMGAATLIGRIPGHDDGKDGDA